MGNTVMQRPGMATDMYIILVGNIPWKCKWQDLKDLVRGFSGNVERTNIYTTPDGRSRGFGYALVRGKEEAMRVAEKINGYEWKGRALIAKLGNEHDMCPIASTNSEENKKMKTKTLELCQLNEASINFKQPQYQAKYQFLAQAHKRVELGTQTQAQPKEQTQAEAKAQIQAHIHSKLRIQAQTPLQTLFQASAQDPGLHMRKAVDNMSTDTQPQAMSCTETLQAPYLYIYRSDYQQGYPYWNPSIVPYGYHPINCPTDAYPVFIDHSKPTVPASPGHVTRGIPINLTNGAVITESRGIFLANLPWTMSKRELREHLSPAGLIVHCELPKGSQRGKGKGYATAMFNSQQEAERAVDILHNSVLKGRRIRVRLDKFATTKRSTFSDVIAKSPINPCSLK